jgi:nucleoside-diphosphate-sugar epimerase
MRVLITGGSGFIGTNIVQHYLDFGYDVMNIDTRPPRNNMHLDFWVKSDILNFDEIKGLVDKFNPNYVYHLAARTDLDGANLEEYLVNTDGVKNVIICLKNLKDLKHVVFASSMLVCNLGHIPANEFDFMPDTIYGESKVIGEKYVYSLAQDFFTWTIVRPTSIWGPWFDVPYKNFFTSVAHGYYMHPKGHRIFRSYGFVLNIIQHLHKIIDCPEKIQVHKKVFYIADHEPIELLNWANIISEKFGLAPPREVPILLLRTAAKIGDLFLRAGIKTIPINSRRLNNLLTQAVYDAGQLKSISEKTPFSLEDAVDITVQWMRENDMKKKVS